MFNFSGCLSWHQSTLQRDVCQASLIWLCAMAKLSISRLSVVEVSATIRPCKDDLFRIYSMTKPITSVAAMQLYEEGKFQLSDPVTKFVPELKGLNVLTILTPSPVEREMTMHQLLMHTAGFSYGFHAHRDPGINCMLPTL